MKSVLYGCCLALVLASSGCGSIDIDTSPEAAAKVRQQELGDLPYHPLVLHLDLSILTYQLYSQSLVWPFDPYYEDLDNGWTDRIAFMAKVYDWAAVRGAEQVAAPTGLDEYRGPGVLSGFEPSPSHDPILYQYSRLHPWSASVTNANSTWAEYLTPSRLTEQIRDVYVCTRTTGQPEGTVSLEALPARQDDAAPEARDILMAFEGGTGDKGEPGQPASHSLMGFALLRYGAGDGDDYDIHIAFRGSRSGSGTRTAWQALSTNDARGNPDWITDLGYAEVSAPHISTIGEVSRGMSRSMLSIFPQLFHCLDHVVGRERSVAPRNIYATGHSLGGGLAQHFASAVTLGNLFGPGGDHMPASLRLWPWLQIKLVTYSAPRVGNHTWAETLTAEHLDSEVFDSGFGTPYDVSATGVTNLDILPRLLDTSRPAAYRVLIPTDPITTSWFVGGQHVGKTVYLEPPSLWAMSMLPDFEAHEPWKVRLLMINTFRDDRIPDTAWAYRDMEELVPTRDDDEAGSAAEYQKLANAITAYYTHNDLWFDQSAFDDGFQIFLDLLAQP